MKSILWPTSFCSISRVAKKESIYCFLAKCSLDVLEGGTFSHVSVLPYPLVFFVMTMALSTRVIFLYSGTTPGPEATESSRGPRRRLYKDRASNPYRGHQHPAMTGMENKILSSGRGSDLNPG